MSEQDQQETRSPLQSERGVTTVKEGVVSQIAGMAAGEVEGVHMGGGASRSAGGLLDRATGSSGQTRGVSVEVGQTEAAIDLKMGIEYGKNILQTVEDVRRRITDRVEGLTGLRIREINATVNDIVFVDEEEKRERRGAGLQAGAEEEVEPREMPARELRPGAREREVTEVEPRSREHTEAQSGPVPEEDVRVRDTPVREDETAELEVGEGEVEKRPEGSEGGGSVRRVPRGGSGSGSSGSGGSGSGGSGSGSSGGDDSGSGRRRGRGGSGRGGRRRGDGDRGDGGSGER